jgi:polyisoprenoid-binding protein YceI
MTMVRSFLIGLAFALVASVGQAAPAYSVQGNSSLQFQGTQQGEKFTGAIKAFEARITYDAADLAHASFDVTMQLKSIDSRNLERDQAMQTPDWFDTGRYPTAVFKTTAFRSTAQGVVADADLTIKGHTKRITFPFQFQKTTAGATLDSRVTLDRLDFGLGAGEWADDSMVGRRVDVIVHLNLTPIAAPVAVKAPVSKKNN